MSAEKKFIKTFDYETAVRLSDSGFSYIKETVNGSQEVYCFVDCDEIRAELYNMEFSAGIEVCLIEDDTLSF